MRLIDADALLHEIEELKKSPWFNDDSYPGSHSVRKEAVEIIEDLCIKDAPTVDAVKATMPWTDPDGTERLLDEMSYEIGYSQGQRRGKKKE